MKIPSICSRSMSPCLLASTGLVTSILDLLIRGNFDPYILAFWLVAAAIEVFARRQSRVPSNVISFITSLAIMFFLRTNVIMINTVPNSSAEPYIQKGAAVFFQPNFYSISNNDLVIIKDYMGSKRIIGRVLDVMGQTYKVEIISRKLAIETSKDNIEGKIVYVTKGKRG